MLVALSCSEFEPLGRVLAPLLILAVGAFVTALWLVCASGRSGGQVHAFRQVPLDRSA